MAGSRKARCSTTAFGPQALGSCAALTFPSTNSIQGRACMAPTDEAHRDVQLQDSQNGITTCCYTLKKQPTVCGCLPCVISRPGVHREYAERDTSRWGASAPSLKASTPTAGHEEDTQSSHEMHGQSKAEADITEGGPSTLKEDGGRQRRHISRIAGSCR